MERYSKYSARTGIQNEKIVAENTSGDRKQFNRHTSTEVSVITDMNVSNI